MRAGAPLAPHLVASRPASEFEGGSVGHSGPLPPLLFHLRPLLLQSLRRNGNRSSKLLRKERDAILFQHPAILDQLGIGFALRAVLPEPFEVTLPMRKEFLIALAVFRDPAAVQGVEANPDGSKIPGAMPKPGPRRHAQTLRAGETRELFADIVDGILPLHRSAARRKRELAPDGRRTALTPTMSTWCPPSPGYGRGEFRCRIERSAGLAIGLEPRPDQPGEILHRQPDSLPGCAQRRFERRFAAGQFDLVGPGTNSQQIGQLLLQVKVGNQRRGRLRLVQSRQPINLRLDLSPGRQQEQPPQGESSFLGRALRRIQEPQSDGIRAVHQGRIGLHRQPAVRDFDLHRKFVKIPGG